MSKLPVRAGAAAVVAAIAVAGCGGEGRSTEAFCNRLASEKTQYLQKYNQRASQVEATKDPLEGVVVGLGSSLEAYGDTIVIFDKLSKVAPDEIQSDVETIRDSLKHQRDQMGQTISNPLAGLASGLVSGVTTMGSWQRTEQFIAANCH